MTEEILLTGGRLTSGVVRVGDTVRRPHTASSGFVGQLLRRTRARGFVEAPEYLGCDEHNRDVFRYIPGDVPPKFRRFEDGQLITAVRLLRRFHEATRESELAGACSVVCHNDPGPNNFVFQQSQPVALIDFDFAAPGKPPSDVGYMAWTWCVSSRPDRQPVSEQAAQVRCLLDAYGPSHEERAGIVDAMIMRQTRNIEFWTERRRAGASPGAEKIDEIIEWSRHERSFTESHRAVFTAAAAQTVPAAHRTNQTR